MSENKEETFYYKASIIKEKRFYIRHRMIEETA